MGLHKGATSVPLMTRRAIRYPGPFHTSDMDPAVSVPRTPTVQSAQHCVTLPLGSMISIVVQSVVQITGGDGRVATMCAGTGRSVAPRRSHGSGSPAIGTTTAAAGSAPASLHRHRVARTHCAQAASV